MINRRATNPTIRVRTIGSDTSSSLIWFQDGQAVRQRMDGESPFPRICVWIGRFDRCGQLGLLGRYR